MARKSNAKPKMKIGKEKSARVCSPAGGVEAGIQTAEEEKQVMPNMYSSIIQSLFRERTRKRGIHLLLSQHVLPPDLLGSGRGI